VDNITTYHRLCNPVYNAGIFELPKEQIGACINNVTMEDIFFNGKGKDLVVVNIKEDQCVDHEDIYNGESQYILYNPRNYDKSTLEEDHKYFKSDLYYVDVMRMDDCEIMRNRPVVDGKIALKPTKGMKRKKIVYVGQWAEFVFNCLKI
jgi:hypothetical protein